VVKGPSSTNIITANLLLNKLDIQLGILIPFRPSDLYQALTRKHNTSLPFLGLLRTCSHSYFQFLPK
jgi:hypothetical protein